jgi:protein TonB
MNAKHLVALAAVALPAGCVNRGAPPRPVSPIGVILNHEDYPAAAIRAEEEGTTQVRLTIGPDGRVANCQLSRSSGSVALDRATCRLLQRRWRFHPAVDRKGRPKTGRFEARISWRLPE